MKFRKLKKANFVLLSSWGDIAYSHIDGVLTEYNYWEYDNGLYTTSGWESEKAPYRQLKNYIKDCKSDDPRLFINKGYCPRCGQKLTAENYKNEIKDSLTPIFEWDFFYCNDCKEQECADFIKFAEEYDKKQKDGGHVV